MEGVKLLREEDQLQKDVDYIIQLGERFEKQAKLMDAIKRNRVLQSEKEEAGAGEARDMP